MRTAVLARPAWQRRAAVVLLPATFLACIALVRYFSGGPRLGPSGARVSAPVTVGEEFHAGVPLPTRGGDVELIEVRPVGVTGAVVVDVRLATRSQSATTLLGTVRGPLTERDGVVVLPTSAAKGLTITMDGREPVYTLDVRMIGTEPGTSGLTGVDVTYRAGFLRQRTARLNVAICLHASSDWRSDRVSIDRACADPW